MKLDRIKFAKLVGWLSYRFNVQIHEYDDLATLDQLTDVDCQPVEVTGKADPATINELMRAIHAGEKIAAIKAYRSMTGYGLKEAKDAVEAQWSNTNCIDGQTLKQQMIDSLKMPDCMFQLETERNAVAEFIGSFSHYKN